MWTCTDDYLMDDGFPCRHMFTTRALGDMKDPARRRLVCGSIGIEADTLSTGGQVHGTAVAVIGEHNRGGVIPATDALVTGWRGTPLGVFTADCVPVLLAARDGSCCGAVHAGWRGMADGIVSEAVRVLQAQFGVHPSAIAAAVGPHIQPCCYAGSDDVLARFGQAGPTLDLGQAAVSQLRGCGIADIAVAGRCTMHEDDLFFSFRRDQAGERMLSVVML